MKTLFFLVILLTFSSLLSADEVFVKIQRVSGNQVAVVKDSSAAGRGMRGGDSGTSAPMQSRRGRGRRTETTSTQLTVITIDRNVKITSAMRERRTFEFRVGAELAGGLRHRVFQNMRSPLSARIVIQGNRITEVNVLIPETDINQSGTTIGGQTVMAVRPKRPPTKRRSTTSR